MTLLHDGLADLRSGRSLWRALDGDAPDPRDAVPRAGESVVTDVCIVGGGVTGAFLAERMTRMGRDVVVIDRRRPETGATAASTGLLLWELDSPLLKLEDRLGFAAAQAVILECHRAVAGIAMLTRSLGQECGFLPRRSVYLSGDVLDPALMREEARLRASVGVDSELIDAGGLEAMGVGGEAALVSSGAAEVDPVLLARGLLDAARARGAQVLSPVVAVAYEVTARGVEVATGEGAVVRAKALVLANGYEMPEFVPADAHDIVTTWALSAPAAARAVPDAVVWEASDPYLYLRPGPGGRIIVGGEDEDTDDASVRERLAPEKTKAILAKLGRRLPALKGVEPDCTWSGLFGQTKDSLPMIGPVPGRPGCFAAFGYGGNGITFSAIAASHLAAAIAGHSLPTTPHYAVGRS